MTRFAPVAAITALSVFAAVPALAQEDAIDPDTLILADDLDGAEIYSDLEDGEWTEEPSLATIGDDWKPIGHIEDVVLNVDGSMYGIVADIGGFLGIGDKHVLVPVSSVVILPHEEGNGSYTLALDETQESLEAMPAVEKGWLE